MSWLRSLGARGNYGSPGVGTVGHLAFELLKGRTGVLATHVPFQGSPQIVTAILAGHIQAAFLPPGLALQQVKAGKMIAIGVSADRRSPLAPELPTLREDGILGADAELWAALAGPATLPAPVQDGLGAAIVEIVRTVEIEQRMLTAGWQPAATPASGLRMLMSHDLKTFGGIIMMHNIQVTT